MDAKQLVDEFQATWAAMKQAMENKADQVQIDRLNLRLDQFEVANQRLALYPSATSASPSATASYDPNSPAAKQKRLFWKMVAYGGPDKLPDPTDRAEADKLRTAIDTKIRELAPQELKALSAGDDSLGGFLASIDVANEITKGVQLISPIRQIARVRPTASRSVMMPVRSGVFAATWIGEMQTRSETTGLSYSMEEIPVNELYAEVIVSDQDLEDSAFDLEAEIAAEAAEQFAKAEGTAFVNGDGFKKPQGFMVAPAVDHEAGGDASNLTGDGLINFLYSLKEAYARNATWVMNRQTIGKIRQLKDGTTNVYLWAPGIAPGAPNTILGVPYVECPDMPNVSGGAFPVALGDFRRGYCIADRISIQVKRLNEKFAEQGQVGFLIRRRVGGQVILSEAIKKLEIASS